MNRLNFFKRIAGSIALAYVPLIVTKHDINNNDTKLNANKSFLLKAPIAGYKYYGGAKFDKELQPGLSLNLVPEFTNQHDYNAIAIYYQNNKIGFIPKADNLILANLLRQNIALQCEVRRNFPENEMHKRIWVTVFMNNIN